MQEDGVDKQENYQYINDKKKSRRLSALNIFLTAVIIVLIIALIVFTVVITSFQVKGESMLPNLKEDNRIVVLKYRYTLEYGDIVVLHSPALPSAMEVDGKTAVKRVFGKAGDTIAFDKSACKWIRNGEYVEEEYFGGEYNDDYLNSFPLEYPELQGNGLTIPEGHLFVLGDNRCIPGAYSLDSHVYGPISEDAVIGKVIYVMD